MKSSRQLIVYHFMFDPTWESYRCPGCTGWVDALGDLSLLEKRDTTLVMVSRAPLGMLGEALLPTAALARSCASSLDPGLSASGQSGGRGTEPPDRQCPSKRGNGGKVRQAARGISHDLVRRSVIEREERQRGKLRGGNQFTRCDLAAEKRTPAPDVGLEEREESVMSVKTRS
jgi:hypothetical protein